MYTKNYSILDVGQMTKEEWKKQQPVYNHLARMGYFTNGLEYQDFHTSLYWAIGHPKPLGVDADYHLVTYPLYQKEILPAFHFLHIPYDYELRILMVNCTYTGLWSVLFKIVKHLCYKYSIKKITLMDRAFFDFDIWGHYGFSGAFHSDYRELIL